MSTSRSILPCSSLYSGTSRRYHASVRNPNRLSISSNCILGNGHESLQFLSSGLRELILSKPLCRRDMAANSSAQAGPPLPPDPSPGSWKHWIAAMIASMILPFLTNRWGPLLKLKSKELEALVIYASLLGIATIIRINGYYINFINTVNIYKGFKVMLVFNTGEVETVVETAEAVTEAIEKVAEEVDRVAEEVAGHLPAGGKLKHVATLIEHIAEETAKDAHMADDAIEKIEEVEKKLDSFTESLINQAPKMPKEANDQKFS